MLLLFGGRAVFLVTVGVRVTGLTSPRGSRTRQRPGGAILIMFKGKVLARLIALSGPGGATLPNGRVSMFVTSNKTKVLTTARPHCV
jgi:hypothetical protein